MMTDFYSDDPKSKKTGFIPDKLYEIVERDELSEDVKIVSEIASRFLDLKDYSAQKPIVLLHTFTRLARMSPSALWTCLEILAGGRKLEQSLSEQGSEVAFSKQAIHQRRNRDLEKIESMLPEIAEAMKTILTRKPSRDDEKTTKIKKG